MLPAYKHTRIRMLRCNFRAANDSLLRLCTAAGILLALGLCVSLPAAGQGNWPERALRILVPYPPGGSTDTLSRLVGQQLGMALGQSVVIENRGRQRHHRRKLFCPLGTR
jgi:hypothetical protein